ncbi:MAG: WecB/TagA/CpsF family glycosyltransferase [Candidatus Limnocylindria bacterium]
MDILGIGFDRLGLDAAAAAIVDRYGRGQRTFVVTANPEFVMLARRDLDVAAIARAADLVVADGTGVFLASRLLGDPLPGRVPGRLLVDRLVPALAGAGSRLYLLGAGPGVAERAADALRAQVSGLSIVGAEPGSPDPSDDEAVAARVRAAEPDAIFVAYGMPKQERWIARNLPRLPSVRLAIGVGGTLDQLAGRAKVPPRLLHRLGLEWLWRLAREPWRWRRQRALPVFVLQVLRQRLKSS